jgi:hypothetical protein
VLILSLLAIPGASRGEKPAVTAEYQLKAVLLVNLAKFVKWPETAFGSAEDPLIIGVLGESPFGDALEIAARDELIERRPVQVRKVEDNDEIRGCHVLFVCENESSRFRRILLRTRGQPALTVADADRFIVYGGMIRLFARPDGRFGLRINNDAAKSAGLEVSAKLLRLAEIVSDD